MQPLLTSKGLIVLESLSFTKTIYAFDYDGTLAKIVRNPSDAFLTETTSRLLNQLSLLVPVAIISGRSAEDLKSRLLFKPQFIVGNHGLEGMKLNSLSMEESTGITLQWMNILEKKNWKSRFGIELENKKFSIAIHYRKSRNKKDAKKEIQKTLTVLQPSARIIEGKSVFNLLPLNAPHKGMAMLDLINISQSRHGFYLGDDDTDEDVFNMKYSQGQLMTVRVGHKKNSQAKYYLSRQSEVNTLLRILIQFHLIPTNVSKEIAYARNP